MALFRVGFTGRGELADRQQKLAQMLSKLMKTTEEFNVAVFMTNHADPGGWTFVADPRKPAGSHVMAHASTVRLMLRKARLTSESAKYTMRPIYHTTKIVPSSRILRPANVYDATLLPLHVERVGPSGQSIRPVGRWLYVFALDNGGVETGSTHHVTFDS